MTPLEFILDEKYKYGKILNIDFSYIDIEVSLEQMHPFDDGYQVEINHGKGYIKGNNERSTLIGFYHMLRLLGVKFLGPGSLNERYPNIKQDDINFNFEFKPRYRHRAVCIEGSVNIDHVIDMIDYLPKVGMNGYFIQFEYPLEFFERWYKEQDKSIDISLETIKEYKEILINEIKKRGLIYHAVGHGWTTKALGIEGAGWHKRKTSDLHVDQITMLAKVDGKRQLFKDIPLNTQLCYSQHSVQEKMAQSVLTYLKKHQEIDILHFWLADDFHNFCTCDDCIKEPPSYFYVQILNRMDDLLTAHHITTKIAFLAYYELLWPTTLKINNEDRFILMFAPITRSYVNSMKDIQIDENDIEPYVQDKTFPYQLDQNLKYLIAWKKHFKGDSFIFDYHLMWDGFKEFSHMRLSNTIAEDIEALKSFDLNGYVSCQLTRQSFPHSLGVYLLTKSLSEEIVDIKQEEVHFFQALYPTIGDRVYAFFDQLKDFIPHAYLRGENHDHENIIYLMDKAIVFIKKYKHTFSEKTMDIYIEYMEHIFELIRFKALNEYENLFKKYQYIIKLMNDYYDILESKLDYYYLKLILKEFIDLKYH